MASASRRVFGLGVAAGALALVAAYLLRLFAGGSFLPELASQAFFSVVPGQIESNAVDTLGSLAKYTTYTVAIAVNLALYGLLSLFFLRIVETDRSRSSVKALVAAGISYAITLVLSSLFLSITQINSQPISLPTLAFELIFPQLVFGFALVSLETRYLPTMREIVPSDLKPVDSGRRLLIAAGAGAVAVALLALYGLGFLEQTNARSSDPSNFFANEVTSNDNFYRVDINIFPPSIQSSSWSLKVGGLVDTPLTLSYDDITALPSAEQYNTLECVSNVVGGDLMSNAQWKGVRLKDLLSSAGVNSSATYVVFKCADGYDVGIPLSKAMEDGTILAYQMNGAPLPQVHGYPLRALVPGYYGMMNPKWITEISLADQTYEGFWQRQGWINEAQYETESTIVNLGDDALSDKFGIYSPTSVAFGAPITILGVAFAGERGISKVEVSTDNGSTWSSASLVAPPSVNSWVLWSFDWSPSARGSYTLSVRATDGEGNLQTQSAAAPFPGGASGWQSVAVSIN